MKQRQIYSVLMMAGCIPFIVAAVAPYLGILKLPIFGDVHAAIAYYALAIASFLAGMQWGLSLVPISENCPKYAKPMCPKRLMLASNLLVLVPWVVLCRWGIGVPYFFSLAVVFVVLVLTDYRLMNRNVLSGHYYRMRLLATAILVTCLISLAFTIA